MANGARRATLAASPADADFVALREASLRGDIAESGRLAARLANYPIPSYVDYYRLYPRLVSAPAGEIRSFLDRHDGTAIADRLRNDWLLLLGRARDWNVFDEQASRFVLNDDTQVKCYALMSRLARGDDVAHAARDLLVQPKYYGEACVDLIGRLADEKKFTDADVWRQVRLAVEYGQGATARRIAAFADVNASLIPQAIDKPAAIVERGAAAGRASREVFLIALGRVARDSHEKAVRALEKALPRLNPAEQAIAWSQIALPASLALAREAPAYWRRTWDAPLSQDGYQWRARAALRAGDWPMVVRAIEAMPRELQKDPAWIYWRGRAAAAQGKADDAQRHYQQLAGQPHFYGLLASEELGLQIAPLPRPVPASAEEIAEAAANPGLRHALKFYELELRFEGNREWNWQLRRLGERQLLAAAEFARQSDALDRMVASADRAKTEIDMSHRYPSPHDDIMHGATQSLGLDKAWVYGLIRQESRFIKSARSVVGASGLMQIMPNTANYVAKKIGMTGFSLSGLNDIRTNITLGTQYLNMVLANLGGSQTLATAAYNAGPSRPRLWRSSLERPVEGAIFAETIPFSETRGYVKNVLANATWYAAHFENRPQSLKARLGAVAPRDANLAELGDLP
ncbi:MAG: lytic transglycosylase domain-containing protein [Burkholderiaceae bacterium]|nr:lytic transglycosylase domain-containing protein [Burkholderiaceae bacterium]